MARAAKKHLVIIGASAAGLAALEAIREVDKECAVTVVSKEKGSLYSRVGLTHFLDGTVKAPGMNMRSPNYARQMNATILTGLAAVHVDFKARTLKLSNRKTLKYDALLVASGSSALILPIPGANLRGVYPCITRNDAVNIDRAIPRVRQAAVIGAGLIGIQAVDALAKRKKKVAVIEMMPHVMPAMADVTAAKMFEDVLRERGHAVVTGARAAEILGKAGRVTGVKLENGEVVPCQLLVMAAGVRPNLEFLEGTRIQKKQGLLVDAHQQTSIKGIYAAGDVAETTDLLSGQRVVIAIWPEALNQGRIAGLNMAGVPTKYEGSMAMNVTSVLGLPIASLGLWQVTDATEYRIHSSLHESKRIYRKLIFKDGRLVGAVLVGSHVNSEAGILHNFIRTRQSFAVTPDQLVAGPISWGRVLRDNRRAGGVGPPAAAAAP
ncbi:MAG: FAD-dependent oxidoreductase [Candidatus Methylomirabilota bacterium]|jgi:NAD(P)H-nitrite reductase large subunit